MGRSNRLAQTNYTCPDEDELFALHTLLFYIQQLHVLSVLVKKINDRLLTGGCSANLRLPIEASLGLG